MFVMVACGTCCRATALAPRQTGTAGASPTSGSWRCTYRYASFGQPAGQLQIWRLCSVTAAESWASHMRHAGCQCGVVSLASQQGSRSFSSESQSVQFRIATPAAVAILGNGLLAGDHVRQQPAEADKVSGGIGLRGWRCCVAAVCTTMVMRRGACSLTKHIGRHGHIDLLHERLASASVRHLACLIKALPSDGSLLLRPFYEHLNAQTLT